MGQTRDEQTAYVGRRRASVAAPESGTPTTPYVGKRRAATPTLERPTLTLPAEPLPVEHSAPSPAAPQLVDQSASRGRTEVDTTTIERVLADLEPVDASPSFAGEDTVIIPLELTRQAAAGRRRAARRATRTGVLAKVPSAPVLVGLAAMTISVGGVMTTDSPDLVPAGQVRLGSVGALSGTDAIGAVRPGVVSRDGDRAAAESADLEAQVDPDIYFDEQDALVARYTEAAGREGTVQIRDFDRDPDRITEMDALIAYLQMTGTLVDFSTYEAEDLMNRR